jgi:hypothetical protein
MHVVIRSYSGPEAIGLFDLIEARREELGALMSRIPGLVAYTAARTGEEGVTVTVCEDKEGADESVRVAREWVGEIASDLGVDSPAISEGSVLLRL